MSKPFAIFRVQPIKTWQKLAEVGNHNNRHVDTPNADPSEKVWRIDGSDDLVADVRSRFDELGLDPAKAGAGSRGKSEPTPIALEFVMTASKSFFDTATPEQLEAWRMAQAKFLHRRFDEMTIVAVWEHQDEETRHWHAVGIPASRAIDKRQKPENQGKWRLSESAYLGRGKDRLSKLQDEYHQAMTDAGVDLARGVRRGHGAPKRRRTEVRDWPAIKAREATTMRTAKAELFKLRQQAERDLQEAARMRQEAQEQQKALEASRRLLDRERASVEADKRKASSQLQAVTGWLERVATVLDEARELLPKLHGQLAVVARPLVRNLEQLAKGPTRVNDEGKVVRVVAAPPIAQQAHRLTKQNGR